ncbi:MAG TPA: hypothetical protein VGZ02_15915 [Candidatus Baltobacteraceae bacterium]|nr:hypothetical protein [Candidatus Baltobacteraceae bacterium]
MHSKQATVFALGAATCFGLVAVLSAVEWFSTHRQGTALAAGGFAAVALLWVAVFFRWKRA